MDIYVFSRNVARVEATRDPVDGETKIVVRLHGDVGNCATFWLNAGHTKQLYAALVAINPALVHSPLTEAEVDELAAQYAEEHAGDTLTMPDGVMAIRYGDRGDVGAVDGEVTINHMEAPCRS